METAGQNSEKCSSNQTSKQGVEVVATKGFPVAVKSLVRWMAASKVVIAGPDRRRSTPDQKHRLSMHPRHIASVHVPPRDQVKRHHCGRHELPADGCASHPTALADNRARFSSLRKRSGTVLFRARSRVLRCRSTLARALCLWNRSSDP